MAGYDFNVNPVQVGTGVGTGGFDYQARKDAAALRKQQLAENAIKLRQAQKGEADEKARDAAAASAYQPQSYTPPQTGIDVGGANLGYQPATVQGPTAFNRGSYLNALPPDQRMQADQQFQQQDFQHQQQMAQLNEALGKANGEQLKNLGTALDLQGRYFGAVDGASDAMKPTIYASARAHAIQAGVPGAEQTPEQYDPGQWQVMKSQFVDVKTALENATKQSELSSKTVQTANGVQQFDPSTNSYNTVVGDLPKTVAPAVNVNVGGGGGTSLTPAALDTAANLYLKTGTLPSMGMGKSAGNDRKAIMNRAAELNAGADIASNKASFGADSSSLKKVQGMLDAVEAYEGTAKKNLTLFITQAKKISDSGSPLLNQPLRAFDEKVLGSPEMSAYRTARQVALTEIARVVNNPNLTGVLSDSARGELADFNPQSATLAQTLHIAEILTKDMDNRHDSLKKQRDDIKGRIGGGSGPTLTNQNQGGGQRPSLSSFEK